MPVTAQDDVQEPGTAQAAHLAAADRASRTTRRGVPEAMPTTGSYLLVITYRAFTKTCYDMRESCQHDYRATEEQKAGYSRIRLISQRVLGPVPAESKAHDAKAKNGHALKSRPHRATATARAALAAPARLEPRIRVRSRLIPITPLGRGLRR